MAQVANRGTPGQRVHEVAFLQNRHEPVDSILGGVRVNERESKVRPVIKWFAEQIEEKVAENDGKKQNWRDQTPRDLFLHLKSEFLELEDELFPECELNQATGEFRDPMNRTERVKRIRRECADIGGIAMMIADWHCREVPRDQRADAGQEITSGYFGKLLESVLGETVVSWSEDEQGVVVVVVDRDPSMEQRMIIRESLSLKICLSWVVVKIK